MDNNNYNRHDYDVYDIAIAVHLSNAENDGPIGQWKNVDDMLSRFDTIHACDGQTDRQTDGIGVAYIRAIAYNAVARKNGYGAELSIVGNGKIEHKI